MSYRTGEYLTATLYVLHSRAYRDTSAIITALSSELGKVSFVAKGIRSKKNAKIALLQPFVPLSAQIYGRNELKNLAKVEALGIGLNLFDTRLYSAMYLNELLMRLLPVELPCPDIYLHYSQALQKLASEENIEPVLRDFELLLLQELGYGIEFHLDYVSGEEVLPECFYQFDLEQGVRLVAEASRNAISGRALINIAHQNWDEATLKVAKKIVRLSLSPLLGNKPLKSRELFSQPPTVESNKEINKKSNKKPD